MPSCGQPPCSMPAVSEDGQASWLARHALSKSLQDQVDWAHATAVLRCQVLHAARLPCQDVRGRGGSRTEPAPRLLPCGQPAPPLPPLSGGQAARGPAAAILTPLAHHVDLQLNQTRHLPFTLPPTAITRRCWKLQVPLSLACVPCSRPTAALPGWRRRRRGEADRFQRPWRLSLHPEGQVGRF